MQAIRNLTGLFPILFAFGFVTLGIGGCGGTETLSSTTMQERLAAMDGWSVTQAADDPYSDHRPDEVICPEGAYEYEEAGGNSGFDVDTGKCNYFTGQQDTLVDLRAGDAIDVRLFHYSLEATEPAEAHVALHAGGEELWSETVAIPAEAELITASVPVARTIPRGTPVYYHVHNHGDNTWSLISLFRSRTETVGN